MRETARYLAVGAVCLVAIAYWLVQRFAPLAAGSGVQPATNQVLSTLNTGAEGQAALRGELESLANLLDSAPVNRGPVQS